MRLKTYIQQFVMWIIPSICWQFGLLFCFLLIEFDAHTIDGHNIESLRKRLAWHPRPQMSMFCQKCAWHVMFGGCRVDVLSIHGTSIDKIRVLQYPLCPILIRFFVLMVGASHLWQKDFPYLEISKSMNKKRGNLSPKSTFAYDLWPPKGTVASHAKGWMTRNFCCAPAFQGWSCSVCRTIFLWGKNGGGQGASIFVLFSSGLKRRWYRYV